MLKERHCVWCNGKERSVKGGAVNKKRFVAGLKPRDDSEGEDDEMKRPVWFKTQLAMPSQG